jgi:polysaccharide pyruvyl transferase WcaK-like protein
MLVSEKTQESYLEEWSKITTDYIKQGYAIRLTATTEEDLLQTKKLHKLLISNDAIHTSDKVPSVEDFIKLASEADVVVAGRMHALILAQIAGATPVPYIISKKIASFSEENLRDKPSELKKKLEKTLAEVLSTNSDRSSKCL